MSKLFIFLFFIISSLCAAQSVALKSNEWQLIGTRNDINTSSLNLQYGDLLWKYDSAQWQYLRKGYHYDLSLNEMTSIKAGEGFWIKPSSDYNLSMPDGILKNKTLQSGWNLLSPAIQDINLTQTYTTSQTPYAWGYENGTWKLWQLNGTKAIETIKLNQGYWLYYAAQMINIGTQQTPLSNGTFSTVTHSSSSNVEDIWNISFKITPQNITSFNIGIKFLKKSTGAYGEFIYYGLSLQNGVLTKPSTLYIKGQKGDGTTATTQFDNTYDPNSLRVNSISLSGDILTLKLGTIMQNQTLAPASTFKGISDYNITIVPQTLAIVDGSAKTLTNLAGFTNTFSGIGISGDISIQ